MSKILYQLIVYNLLSFTLFAQNFFSDFGHPTQEEFLLKKCSFDPEAEIIVLKDEAYTDFSLSGKIFSQHHLRIKILNERAVDKGNIIIPYYSRDGIEAIDNINGLVINVNAAGNPEFNTLGSSSIFINKRNDYFSEIRLTMPNVKVGSIIEYSYQITTRGVSNLDDWYFQKDVPVIFSRFTLNVSKNLEYTYQISKSDIYTIKTTTKDRQITFEAKNIPAFIPEPFMDSPKDYLQRVSFQLSGFSDETHRYATTTSWKMAAKELMSLKSFGDDLNKNLSGSEEFTFSLKLISDKKEKMKRVYNYVKQNLSWNGLKGIYIPDNLKTAWERKLCSNPEINLILVNLLKQAGLDADPLLISERNHGRVYSDYPFLNQFNCVYATVLIDDKRYYLNAADKTSSLSIIPNEILNTIGFMVTRRGGELININDQDLKYLEYINVITTFNDNGIAESSLQISSSYYAKVQRLNINNEKGNTEDEIAKKILKEIPGIHIIEYENQNKDDDNLAFIQSLKFSFPIEMDDKFVFLNSNLIIGFDRNPFVSEKRIANINFGYRKSVSINHTINIPKNYQVDFLPNETKYSDSKKGLYIIREVVVNQDSSLVEFKFRIDIGRSLFLAEEYPDIKSFFNKMISLFDEKMILRKK